MGHFVASNGERAESRLCRNLVDPTVIVEKGHALVGRCRGMVLSVRVKVSALIIHV